MNHLLARIVFHLVDFAAESAEEADGAAKFRFGTADGYVHDWFENNGGRSGQSLPQGLCSGHASRRSMPVMVTATSTTG